MKVLGEFSAGASLVLATASPVSVADFPVSLFRPVVAAVLVAVNVYAFVVLVAVDAVRVRAPPLAFRARAAGGAGLLLLVRVPLAPVVRLPLLSLRQPAMCCRLVCVRRLATAFPSLGVAARGDYDDVTVVASGFENAGPALLPLRAGTPFHWQSQMERNLEKLGRVYSQPFGLGRLPQRGKEYFDRSCCVVHRSGCSVGS